MNNRELRICLAGFGGQGILFAGKVISTAGLIENRELSWLPSYGPEMRGGTANCSVCLSDKPIGSPLVLDPNALIALNQPSYDKFIDCVVEGGFAVVDSGLVQNIHEVSGINVSAISATKLAEENDIAGLANIIAVGKLWSLTHFCERDTLDKAIEACVPASKQQMIEFNKKALIIGMEA